MARIFPQRIQPSTLGFLGMHHDFGNRFSNFIQDFRPRPQVVGLGKEAYPIKGDWSSGRRAPKFSSSAPLQGNKGSRQKTGGAGTSPLAWNSKMEAKAG